MKTNIQLTIYQQVILSGFLFSNDSIGLSVPNETLLAYKPGEMIEGAPYPLVFLSTLLAREVTVLATAFWVCLEDFVSPMTGVHVPLQCKEIRVQYTYF
jgi:hypothetical protein